MSEIVCIEQRVKLLKWEIKDAEARARRIYGSCNDGSYELAVSVWTLPLKEELALLSQQLP